MFRTGYHHHHHHLEPTEARHARGTLPDGRSDTILAHDRALWYGVRMAVNPNHGQGTCGEATLPGLLYDHHEREKYINTTASFAARAQTTCSCRC